jgi:class 3 adenylate cyclase/TolB-like protein/tetratricopeptide (TPR) repeat protein
MVRDRRRLAAIVSADVAGYSRLMSRDESGTLASLKAVLRELIDPKIAEYSGRTVKSMGDGLLLEFASVVDAVHCAIDVQRGMAERNVGVPLERQLQFRIGINVGDIIIEGEDIFGDGVNVAARLQALAEPGGICVSRVVRDQVLDKLTFVFEGLGAQQVKNIARPVEAYRVNFAGESEQVRRQKGSRRWPVDRALRRPGLLAVLVAIALSIAGLAVWKLQDRLGTPGVVLPVMSVAVLPIASATGDSEAARFAEAMTRALITGIPRKREYGSIYLVSGARGADAVGLKAADRRPNVRYVLEGHVQRADGGHIVDLRLIDATSGAQSWSGRHTLSEGEVAAESSVAMRNLCGRLRNVIVDLEGQRVMAAPQSSLSPRELVLRAFETGGKDASAAGMASAGELVDAALKIDPNLVPGLVLRAALINNQADADPHLDRERAAREQDRLTALAVRIDDSDPAAWNWRAAALAYLQRWDAALDAAGLAISLDPYETRWQNMRADLLVRMARPDDALATVERALALQPVNSGALMSTACEAYLMSGRAEQAIATCEKASGQINHWEIHLLLAAAYANNGEQAKAAAAHAEVLRVVPGFTIAELRAKHPMSSAALGMAETHLYEGLRKAGFPER